MAKNYVYQDIDISELLLDDENPRFASSVLVRGNAEKVTQEAIIAHLCKHARIVELAHRIDEVQELHGSELITCFRRDNKYVVLEGNRRVCACKLLLDRTLIPGEYLKGFPFVKDVTKQNIKVIHASVYPDRNSVLSYLSDRHITGVKKWSPLEKNNYYMNLFNTYRSLDKLSDYTTDSLGTIKTSIIKYQFFMDAFDVLKSKHKNIEIENLDYLPMVDRFMGILSGNDKDVGLCLSLDEKTLKYSPDFAKAKTYNKILMLIGEAFLLRSERKKCADGELSKVISNEIKNDEQRKQLIINDKRIPGLISLIKEYKEASGSRADEEPDTGDCNTIQDADGSGVGAANQGNSPVDKSIKILLVDTYSIEEGTELYLKGKDIINVPHNETELIKITQMEIKGDYIFKDINVPGEYSIGYLYKGKQEILTLKVNKKSQTTIKGNSLFKKSNQYTGEIILGEMNDVVQQLYGLNYKKYNLLYTISFRAIIENMSKEYIAKNKIQLSGQLGDNVSNMADHLLSRVSGSKDDPQQQLKIGIHEQFKGFSNLKNFLLSIKEKFGSGSYSNLLHSMTHNPAIVAESFAEEIANEIIIPLHMLIYLVEEKL